MLLSSPYYLVVYAHFLWPGTYFSGLDEHRVVHLKKWIGHFEVLTALAFCCCCAVPYFFQVSLSKKLFFCFINGQFTLALNLRRLCWRQQQATATILLALATLGDATQTGLFLFMSRRPRWPRQVSDCRVSLSPALSHNFCKWKYSLRTHSHLRRHWRQGQ